MRFISMELKNWRSFRNKHKIIFAYEKIRNITVLIGQNGSGKTALLNAFTWVLFEETTAGFRRPDDLFNHSALAAMQPGDSDSMKVVIEFDHDSARYFIMRRQDVELSQKNKKHTLSEIKLVAKRTKNGKTETVDQDEINSILPSGLHPFFFFPAENIGKDIDKDDLTSIRASMSRAIDVLLGIEVYDNALNIISTALKTHLKTPNNAPKDELIRVAEEQMNSAREVWEKADNRKKLLPSKINNAKQYVEELKIQMETNEDLKVIKEKYNDIETEIEQTEQNISQLRQDQAKSINKYCLLLFGNKLFSDAILVLKKAYDDGKIPPRVSAGLLDELIEQNKRCICGREIGELERNELISLRSITIDDILAEVANDLRGRLPTFIKNEEGNIDQISAYEILDYDCKAAKAEYKLAKLHLGREEIIEEQPDVNISDPSKIREAWMNQEKILLRYQEEFKKLRDELPELERKKNETENTYQKSLAKHDKIKTIAKAREMLSTVESILSKIQKNVRKHARKDVERAMNNFFTPLLLKNYKVHLTEDFQHKIVDESTGKTIGASSSETALATFAFVGAIAALIPVYSRLEKLLPANDGKSVGSIKGDAENAYPVVLDAPFSPFGKDYAESFSEALPDLLPQSIIIVREDQLEYIQNLLLNNRVGAAYVLQLYTGKSNTKQIKWHDDDYDYVIKTNGNVSYTEIKNLPVE